MIRQLFGLALIAALLGGCAAGVPQLREYAERDLYVMMVMDAEERGDYNASAAYNLHLYKKTGEVEFRNAWVEALLRAREYDRVVKITADHLERGEDRQMRRYQALAYTGKRDFTAAIATAQELIKTDRVAEDYLLLADLHALRGENARGLEYYKSAYALDPSEAAVDKIAMILYERLSNTKEALAYYESHIIQHGCSEFLCQRLAHIYAREGNIGGVITAYKRIYKQRPDPIVGQKLVELYLLQKEHAALIRWLEETRFNDLVLLEVYKYERAYAKASLVALRLYEERGDIEHLALHAMFAYEAGNPNDRQLVLQTVKKLETVVAQSDYHVHLNYLGYLLIDYSIDVARGVELVARALESEPDNLFYTDSLAWGHYRLGNYAKAYELIKLVKEGVPNDATVQEHFNAIKKAYDKSRKKKK
ncbi:MAG: hypothetical protein AB7E49_11840 [Campylobacterales bacterium]